MKKCCMFLMIMMAIIPSVQASIIIYTDLTAFQNASGLLETYDFDSDTAGWITSPSYSGPSSTDIQDFGNFIIDSTTGGIYSSEIRLDPSGSGNDIFLNSKSNTADLQVIFDMDINSFGFTYGCEGNNSWDHSTFSLLGTTWDLGTPGNSGFFGIVETTGTIAAGTAFSFGQSSSNWSGVSFDNLMYDQYNSVPEPATMLLFASGLIALGCLKRRPTGKTKTSIN